MPELSVLLVDSQEDALLALRDSLNSSSFCLTTVLSRSEAMRAIRKTRFDVILTALKLDDGSGLDLLEFAHSHQPGLPVIIMTAYGSVETAVEALRHGAYDYILQPVRITRLRQLLSRISETLTLRQENERLRQRLYDNPGEPQLIGVSDKMLKVIDFIKQVAPSQSTVLIAGESGTGKEIAAIAIHHYSKRADRPFIKINCGAIPETLLESELFGYEKGAFTGAAGQKKGKIELADGGTLFLDEIGELSQAMQVKLLRVLQSREFERLGGTTTLKVDVRIIAATNADLEAQVAQGIFRRDLFYRLNVISFRMPALRERPEDIPFLAQFFIDRYNQINEKQVQGIDPAVLRQMQRYPWRGNVRELENTIERAVVLSRGSVLHAELFPNLAVVDGLLDSDLHFEVGMSMEEIEREVIQRTLRFYNYDKNKTARTLQISLATLYRKIKVYRLETA